MFFVLFVFALCIAVPFSLRLLDPEHDYVSQLGPLLGPWLLACLAVFLVWRLIAARRARDRRRAVNPKAAAALTWPRRLTREQMERYCAEYLRQQGWLVAPARSSASEDTYLSAKRDTTRLVVLCDLAGEELNPAIIRAFAASAALFEGAAPVLVTRAEGRLPPPAEAAGRQTGVRLLRVEDLATLAGPPQLQAAG